MTEDDFDGDGDSDIIFIPGTQLQTNNPVSRASTPQAISQDVVLFARFLVQWIDLQ